MPRAERLNAQPDAELLQLCREFHRIRANAAELPVDAIEDFCHAARVLRVMADVITKTRPTTNEGRKAAAGVGIAALQDSIDPFAVGVQ